MSAFANKRRAALTAVAFAAACSLAAGTANAAFTITYNYDKAGRLTKASYGGNSGFTYTYDSTGNIVKIGKRFPWPMFLPAINAGGTVSIPTVPLAYRDETASSVLEKN